MALILLAVASAAAATAKPPAPPTPTAPKTKVGPLLVAVDPETAALQWIGPANDSNFTFLDSTTSFGQVTIRMRSTSGTGSAAAAWGAEVTLSAADAKPMQPLPSWQLAASTQPVPDSMLNLTLERRWAAATDGPGGILMWYTLHNDGDAEVEVGAFRYVLHKIAFVLTPSPPPCQFELQKTNRVYE